MVLKFDARRERNILGGIAVVGLLALAVSRLYNDGALSGTMFLWIPVILVALAVTLQTHKIEVDLDSRRIRIRRGFWLFAKWQEESFTTPRALAIGTRMTRYGPMYDVQLLYDNTGSVSVLELGYERALKRLLRLTEPCRIPLKAGQELELHGPRWLAEALRQRPG